MALQLQASRWDNFGSLPKLGHCPWQVIRFRCRELSIQLLDSHFHPLTKCHFWQPNCEYEVRPQIAPGEWAMLGELMNIPTDRLIDMLYIILAGKVAISASDAGEIEQIQRELQRRGGQQCWSFQTVN